MAWAAAWMAACGWQQAAARAVRSASTAACGIERQRGRRGCRATQRIWVHEAGRGCAFVTAGTQKQNVFLLLQCPSACMAYCLWPWWARGGFSMTPCRGSIPRAILIIVQCLGCFVVCIFTYSSTVLFESWMLLEALQLESRNIYFMDSTLTHSRSIFICEVPRASDICL